MTTLARFTQEHHPQGICSWCPLMIAALIVVVLLSVSPLPPEQTVASAQPLVDMPRD